MRKFLSFGIVAIWAILGAFFSACVDINLKSELPKVDYYALDNIALSRVNCGTSDIVAIEAIEIPARLAGKNIFYSDKNRISKVEGINLNDSLKGSLESMLIKSLANHCIKAITPPFSGIKIERFLRVKVIDFGAEKGVESRGDLVDSTSDLGGESRGDSMQGDSKGESTHESAKKAQNLAKISFVFVLHQNGTILQSGIITEYSAISDFSGEHIFNALQRTTNTALKSLVDKMIPK